MRGIQITTKILEQYNREDINFDVYIVADAQTQTIRNSDPRISHADESEFFSRTEFAEIASALFNVFGFARVFYDEISFIEYIIHNNIDPQSSIVYNFSRDGARTGKKSLIPAFCDLYGLRYTGSNAFVISLLRSKRVYSDFLSYNGIRVPDTQLFLPGYTKGEQILSTFENKDILIKNVDESASIGLKPCCRMTLTRKQYQNFISTAMELNSRQVLVQEFISGTECEVLVLEYCGNYFALDPVEIVFTSGQSFMDSETSNNYSYTFKLHQDPEPIRKAAVKAAELLQIKDYARFDFRIQNGIAYLFDIAGTPYTIRHSSVAYLFEQYGLNYEDIYKVIVTCMLSNYRHNQL